MTTLKPSLPDALRRIRKARGLSQEAFSDVSSRTYLSSLERDLKSPTLNKLAELCGVMEVHPLTLMTLAYAGDSERKINQLLEQVRQELNGIIDGGEGLCCTNRVADGMTPTPDGPMPRQPPARFGDGRSG